MKKSKKLMLLSIGAMSAVAVATGAVSTMAWFQAEGSASITALSNVNSSNIQVDSHAQSDAFHIELKVNWSSLSNVDLTAGEHVDADGENVEQVIGGAYVIDSNDHVKANTSNSVVKAAEGSLTLDGDIANVKTQKGPTTWEAASNAELLLLDGVEVTVKLAADGQLRIGTSLIASGVGTGAVGAYDGSDIVLGKATISLSKSGETVTGLTYTYAAADGSSFSYTDKLAFYYSVSPKSNTAVGDDAIGISYGKLTAKL